MIRTAIKKDIGERLKQIRLEQGLSLRELEKLSGISNSGIARIESGKHAVNVEVLTRLLTPLGYKIELKKTE